jgi:hypothetical protein
VGEHIAFAPGEYRPGTLVGDALVAHELAHVMQQGGALAWREARPVAGAAANHDAAPEAEASAAAARALAPRMVGGLGMVRALGATLGGAFRAAADTLGSVAPRAGTGLRLQRCTEKPPRPAAAEGPVPDYDSFCDASGDIATPEMETAAFRMVQNTEQLDRVYDDAQRGNARAKKAFHQIESTYYWMGQGVAEHTYSLECSVPVKRELTASCIPDWSDLNYLSRDRPGGKRIREVIAEGYAERATALGMRNNLILAAINALLAGAIIRGALKGASRAGAAGTEVKDLTKGTAPPQVKAPPAAEVKAPPAAEVKAPPAAEVKAPPAAEVKAPPAAEVKAPGTYRPCFLAGTQVKLAGRPAPIEQVTVGDQVLGADLQRLLPPGPHRVTTLHRGRTRSVARIHVNGASIYSTRAHRFYVTDRGWVPAAELRPGDPLSDAGGATLRVSAVELLALADEAATFDLTVEGASTYFVQAGGRWVLVHNGGPEDFERTIYWFFGNRPRLRPEDLDGLSVWKTTSRADVNTLMDHRVNVVGRPAGDPHGYLTEAQLQEAGLVAPQTPSKDPLASKLSHHSLRPAAAPEYPAELKPAEMEQLSQTATSTPKTVVKPSQVKC